MLLFFPGNSFYSSFRTFAFATLAIKIPQSIFRTDYAACIKLLLPGNMTNS